MLAYIETYGCAFAQAESEMIAGMLMKAGFAIVSSPNHADVLIVVTCHVKEATEKKILYRIKELGELYPDKPLIVYGCLPQAYPEKVKEANPKASLVGNHSLRKILKAVEEACKRKVVEFLDEKPEVKLGLPRVKRNPVIGIVPICEGCVGNCAYCSTKFSRGEIFSYPLNAIVKEVCNLVKGGCKEIWITAQDTAAYGIDINTSLPELLNEISKIPGKFYVRVGMMNPRNVKRILPELLDAYESEKIYKFLHIPVQSGSDKILRLMKRGYTVEEFVQIVEAFRERFPQIQIWTDIIVGFPEESEKDFEKTKELLETIKPDWVNVARYSLRPNTLAAKMKQIPTNIKKARSRKITELVKKIVVEKNSTWIGWQGEILVNEKGKEGWVGRNYAYKPVVVHADENLLGKFVKVRIVKATNVLFGEILESERKSG
jgi:MiaB-like tRNA modifying enzyme